MPYNSLLKDPFYIKIIILYVMREYDLSLTNQKLTDLVLEEAEIDYFDFQKCLYDLTKISLIKIFKEDNENKYLLTEKGVEFSSYFEKKIPYIIRKKLNDSISNQLSANQPKTCVESDVLVSHTGEFNVYLKIFENGDLLFELNLNVGDRELAFKTKEYFLNNAQKIYSQTTTEVMKGVK